MNSGKIVNVKDIYKLMYTEFSSVYLPYLR